MELINNVLRHTLCKTEFDLQIQHTLEDHLANQVDAETQDGGQLLVSNNAYVSAVLLAG